MEVRTRQDAEEESTGRAALAGRDEFFTKPVSPVMKELERIVGEIACTDIPVLVVGESGSGKEVIAQQIHDLSSAFDAPFVKLACAGLTPQLAEQMIRFDTNLQFIDSLSKAGTLFLDEVGDLDQASQPRLLHVLPDGGRTAQNHGLQARIISSTGRNLEEEIRQGRFREDLYYRLNGVCLRLPPLRRRREDIPFLVDFFLTKYAALLDRPKPRLTARTVKELVSYHWPGNIRQLEYAVRKIVVLGDGGRVFGDLHAGGADMGSDSIEQQRPSLKQAARAASREAERELILKALERTHWNRKRAALELRISYKALLYKLKQIGLDESSFHLGAPGDRR